MKYLSWLEECASIASIDPIPRYFFSLTPFAPQKYSPGACDEHASSHSRSRNRREWAYLSSSSQQTAHHDSIRSERQRLTRAVFIPSQETEASIHQDNLILYFGVPMLLQTESNLGGGHRLTLVMYPTSLIPPSATTGTPLFLAYRATSYTAVPCKHRSVGGRLR